MDEVAQQQFFDVVVFFDVEINDSVDQWCHVLVNKFLGHGFSLEFIDQEMRLRWNVSTIFLVSALSKNFLLFVQWKKRRL